MKKYSEARCMKCPLLCMKRKRYPSRMSFCNGDTSCNIVLSIWDECSLIHHLPATDDDYLSLTGGAEEAAGEVVHPFATCAQ